jgi:hypothetical protein
MSDTLDFKNWTTKVVRIGPQREDLVQAVQIVTKGWIGKLQKLRQSSKVLVSVDTRPCTLRIKVKLPPAESPSVKSMRFKKLDFYPDVTLSCTTQLCNGSPNQ